MAKKNNIRVVQLTDYERKQANEITSTRDDFVTWGQDNSMFDVLIDAYDNSVTNRRLIDGVTEMIYGRGLDALDSSKKPEMYARMKSLLPEKEVMRIASDFYKLGRCAIQVNWDSGHKSWSSIYHADASKFALEEANEEGEIEAVWFTNDWTDIRKNPPTRIPMFGTSKEKIEILYITPYQSGHFYFPQASWQSGLEYAHMEKEMSAYHNNEISMGFSATKLINFNNGVPDIDTQKSIEKDITKKWAGGQAKSKIVIAFNDNKDAQATIDDIQLGDAHDRYQFLSDEAEDKLMMAHKVVYPLFTFDRSGTGLGNNAEELKNAYELMMEMVIRPKQDFLLDAFDTLLAMNDIALRLYFKPLKPANWKEDEVVVTDKETAQEQGLSMSSDKPNVDDATIDKMFTELEQFGEDEDLENWELVSEEQVDYELEEAKDDMIQSLNKVEMSVMDRVKTWLVSTGVARPNAKSSQDGSTENYNYKVRYQYAPLSVSDNSRDFCKKMVSAKKIYRKEDIIAMEKVPVNKGWGLSGADTYSIWLYKGGGNCHHFWMRKTYRAKGVKPDAKNPNAEVSVNQSKKDGFKPQTNDNKVAKRPVDMPNNGFVNK